MSAALSRRHMVLGLAGAAWPTRYALAAPKPISVLGVFSLLGDGLQIVYAAEATDTRLDRNMRESLPTKDLGLDQAALRAVREVTSRQLPGAKLQMFRATAPLQPAEQRAVADGATRAELPAWVVSAIQSAGLSHVLLITRHRGDASFRVNEGFTIGRGGVEGIGYYLDTITELKNIDTGRPSTGFLGAYAMLRLQLIDAQTGDMVGSQDVRTGQIFGGRNDSEAANIWNALDPTEKVSVLRRMVQDNVARVLPAVFTGS